MEAFPPETIVEIMMQSGDIGDILALASACKRLYSIFDKHSAHILKYVTTPYNRDFDEALAVVRATAIVKESYARGVLPPKPFPFDQLTRTNSPATLIEYQKINNLTEFLKLIELEFAFLWRKYLPYLKEDLYELRTSWKVGFSESMLQVLLMNAVLAGEMAEPFWKAAQEPIDPSPTGAKILQSIQDPKSRHLGGDWQRDESGMTWVIQGHYDGIKDWLNDEDMKYLESYTGYGYSKSRDLRDSTFDKLAKYFRLPDTSAECLLPYCFQGSLRGSQDDAFFEHPEDQENLPHFRETFNSNSPLDQMPVAILHLQPHLPERFSRRFSPAVQAQRRTIDFVPFGCFNVHTYDFDSDVGDSWEPGFKWGLIGDIRLLEAHRPRSVDGGGKYADLIDIMKFHGGDFDGKFEEDEEKENSPYDLRCQAEADWDTRWMHIMHDGLWD